MIDRIDLDRTFDFTDDEQARLSGWIGTELAERPARRGTAFVIPSEAGAYPSRTTTNELAGWLRANGLHRTARRIERAIVPEGQVVVLVMGDEVRVRVVPADTFAPDTLPRGATALGVLGLLVGGAR